MISEFKAFFSAFQQGRQLANPATWKNRQAAAGSIAALLGSMLIIAKGFGYDIPIDRDALVALAGGIAAAYGVFNTVITVITSAKVGVPAKGPPDAEP